MTGSETLLRHPFWTENPDGQPRRVGVELEMSGLSVDEVAQIAAETLKLSIADQGRYERVLAGDPAGAWIVEVDFHLLKMMGREEYPDDSLAGGIGQSAEDVLNWFAEALVPCELVSPPLPLERLDDIEKLIRLLRRAGAKGTSDKLTNAFGMQFNPEIPSAQPDVLVAYLKAFLCLYDWLFARAGVNVARRVTGHVDPFPIDYVRRVIDPGYWPDLPTMIDDYLDLNLTRNRALDLLPLFAHLDKVRVRKRINDPLIKTRPAFHYRLPDCEIHLRNWGLLSAWNDWVEVELMAADRDRLVSCCAAYQEFLASPMDRWLGDWKRELEATWLAR